MVSGRLVPAGATQEKTCHHLWPWPTIYSFDRITLLVSEELSRFQSPVHASPAGVDVAGVAVAMRSPVPVWVWVDYPRVPRYIALNLQLIHKYAPPPHFQVHLVNLSSVQRHLPELPSEFWRLSHRAAPSDAARMALMARHGGLYLDADFLVARPLLPIVEALQQYDMVVYNTIGTTR